MKYLATLSMVSLLLIGANLVAAEKVAADKKPAANADSNKLAGAYHIVSGERNGQPIPADRLRQINVRISKDKFTTLDQDEKEIYVATYTIDKSKAPWRISMTATVTPDKTQGMTAHGLIEQKEDNVRLIYALPGGAEPASFKTADKQQLFVLKRAAL